MSRLFREGKQSGRWWKWFNCPSLEVRITLGITCGSSAEHRNRAFGRLINCFEDNRISAAKMTTLDTHILGRIVKNAHNTGHTGFVLKRHSSVISIKSSQWTRAPGEITVAYRSQRLAAMKVASAQYTTSVGSIESSCVIDTPRASVARIISENDHSCCPFLDSNSHRTNTDFVSTLQTTSGY